MPRKPKPKPKKPRAKKYARYSDQLRAEALAALIANRGNVEKTARQFNVRPSTLRAWRDGTRHPEAANMCDEKRGPMADRLEEVAWKLLEGLDNPAKVKKAPLNQVATAMGIAIDKARLLRGEPTDISELRDDEKIREFRERYNKRNDTDPDDDAPDDAANPVGADDAGEPADPAQPVPPTNRLSGAGE